MSPMGRIHAARHHCRSLAVVLVPPPGGRCMRLNGSPLTPLDHRTRLSIMAATDGEHRPELRARALPLTACLVFLLSPIPKNPRLL